jgi:hypothetical protein
MKMLRIIVVVLVGVWSSFGQINPAPAGQIRYSPTNGTESSGADGTGTPYTIGPIPTTPLSFDDLTVLRITKADDTAILQVRASGEGAARIYLVTDAGILNAPSGLGIGNSIGSIQGIGYTGPGSAFKVGGAMHMVVDGTPDSGGVPVKFQFQTYNVTLGGSVIPLILNSSGSVSPGLCTSLNLSSVLTGPGQVCYCTDCKVTAVAANVVSNATCTGSGGGSLAINVAGTAKCQHMP